MSDRGLQSDRHVEPIQLALRWGGWNETLLANNAKASSGMRMSTLRCAAQKANRSSRIIAVRDRQALYKLNEEQICKPSMHLDKRRRWAPIKPSASAFATYFPARTFVRAFGDRIPPLLRSLTALFFSFFTTFLFDFVVSNSCRCTWIKFGWVK